MSILTGGVLTGRIRKCVRYPLLYCVAGLVLPLVYLSIFALPEYVERTRISENALLPGLVDETWADHGEIERRVRALNGLGRDERNHKRANYVREELQAAGLETYTQNFHANLTHTVGTNVVGVIRAVRATPGEAILLAFRLDAGQHNAIAAALAIAQHSKSQTYWARDLIFLFVDSSDTISATLAWVRAYIGEPNTKYVQAEMLPTHSGTIVGGVALDLSIADFTHFDIQFIGANGLLPNMDVFNLMVRLCEKNDIKPTIQHQMRRHAYANIEVLWREVATQAFDELENVHSILNHYRIHSVTLRAARHRQYRTKSPAAAALVLEGGLRSFNNILEKFHQSYFFYLLVSPHQFLSIAYYFPTLGGQLLALLALQLHAYFCVERFESSVLSTANVQIGALLVYFAHVIGFEQMRMQSKSELVVALTAQSQLTWALVVFAVHFVWPWLNSLKITSRNEHAAVRCIFYNSLTLALLCIGLLNVSVALYVGVYLLVSSIVTRAIPTNNVVSRLVYALVMHPVVFYVLTAALLQFLGVWPPERAHIKLKDLMNPANPLLFALHEGYRYLAAHMQHNTMNFLLYIFVLQPAHSLFISTLGRQYAREDNELLRLTALASTAPPPPPPSPSAATRREHAKVD